MEVHSHKELIVWQKGMDLLVAIYACTERLPKCELYGLTSQMRRAVVSIPANIAEGRRRGTRKEYRYFLQIAYGSGGELETYLEAIKRLPYGTEIDVTMCEKLLDEVMRMLNSMISKIQP